MFDRVLRVVTTRLAAVVRALDPAALSPATAVALVDSFSHIERLAAAGKTIVAGRAADGDEWKQAGDRSPADWLAKRTGTSVGEARAALDTAAKLPDAPGTDAAFRDGTLSDKQAEAIAPAAAADPSAESRLLEMARHQALQKLRDESARVRAAADLDLKARHERIRKARFWRRWTDPDGMRKGMYGGTAEECAAIEAAAQPFIDARIDAARRSGEHEPFEAYAFDGLAAMAAATIDTPIGGRDDDDDAADGCGDEPSGPNGTTEPNQPTPKPPRGGRGRRRLGRRRELIAVLNLHAHDTPLPEPTCEIAGIGPISLDVLQRRFSDALVQIVIRKGVDMTVAHTGRTANAVQETAILVRQHGRCARPGCGLPISEIDHTDDYINVKVTGLDNLVGLCGHDHDLKTSHGHTYHRDSDGSTVWVRPDGTEERERPPP